MRKLGSLSLVLLLAGGVLSAQDGLAVSGDLKTGLIIEKVTGSDPTAYVGHNDDGGTPGRVRLNFAWTKGNFVLKWRSQYSGDQHTDGINPGKFTLRLADDIFSYAYGAASFLDGQFRLGVGKLDDAVWSIGGEVGEIWDNVDNGSGARFEVMPGILPGLNLGLTLPSALGDGGAALSPADYFAEVAYGAKYDTDSINLRVSFKGDAEKDYTNTITNTNGWKAEDGGGKLLYGVDLKFLDSLVPGLKFAVIGRIQGIKTNDNVADSALNTTNWARVMYNPGPLEVYLKGNLETWAKGKNDWKDGTTSAFTAKAGGSYAVTPWFKPSLGATLVFNSYDDNFKVGGKDPAALDKFEIEPAVEFDLGNGLTVKPVLNIAINPANSVSAGKNEAKVDTKVMVRLTYSF